MVGVLLVVRVEQLDRAAGIGERERQARRGAALRADQRDGVADVAGRVLAHAAGDVAPERQGALPQLGLAELAAVDLAVRGGLELLDAVVDRLAERDEVGRRSARADRLVDADFEHVGAVVAGHLGQQLLVLVLLRVAVEVGHPAALLGAAVDREQPAVAELDLLPLAPAIERVHVHAQRVRLAREHRAQQPSHRGLLRGAMRVDDLLDVAVDLDVVALTLEVDARAGDLLAQIERDPPRVLAFACGVELAEDLDGAGGRTASGVGLGRIQPRPQQREHLLAVELRDRQPERLEL